jgi:hypothetical protein
MSDQPGADLRLVSPRLAPLTGAGIWLMLACLTMMVVCLAGCGGSQKQTAATPKYVNDHVLQLKQGVSVEFVKEQLGEPEAEWNDGNNEGLSYGIWQLAFVNGRLRTRSKVVVPKNGHVAAESQNATKKILRLQLGTKLGKVEALLGTPEVVSVIYERQSQPIRILRYGSWGLTFVHGALSLRAQ